MRVCSPRNDVSRSSFPMICLGVTEVFNNISSIFMPSNLKIKFSTIYYLIM